MQLSHTSGALDRLCLLHRCCFNSPINFTSIDFYLLDLIRLSHVSFSCSPLQNGEVIQLMLHVADISNPTKDWPIHQQWTERVMEEFFTQVSIWFILSIDMSRAMHCGNAPPGWLSWMSTGL